MRVLLIEADPDRGQALSEALATAAKDDHGQIDLEAIPVDRLDAARARRSYDAILLDPNPPDSRGLENLDKIKSLAPRVPVVFVDRSSRREAAREAIARGALEVVAASENDGASLLASLQSAVARQRFFDELLDGKEHLETVLATAAEAVVSLDESQRIILFNEAAERIFGYRKNEVLGKPLGLLLPERFAEAHADHIRKFAEEPTPGRRMAERREVFGRRKDGSEFAMQAGISKSNRRGHVVFTAILEDLTERRRSERALNESESRLAETLRQTERQRNYFQGLLDSMDVGLTVEGPDGTINFANAKLSRVLGRSADELIGQDYASLYKESERGHVAEETRRGLEATAVPFESVLLAQGGAEIPVLVTANRFRESGQLAGTVTTFADLSERKKSERERALLAAIVESSDEAILSKNLDGTILTWNRGAEVLYGYTAAEAIGRSVLIHVPADRAQEVPDILSRIKRGERIQRLETARIKKNGERVDVSLTVSPIFDETGRIVGASSLALDITERKRAEGQVQRQLRRITALRDIDMAITGSLDLRVMLKVFLDQVVSQLNVDSAAVLLLNPHTQTLDHAVSRGFVGNVSPPASVRMGEPHAGVVALERRMVSVPDLALSRTSPAHLRWLESEGFKTYFGVPLLAKGHCRGVLEVYHRTPLAPNDEWTDFLHTLAGQGAIAIDSATMFNELERSNIDLALAYDSTLEGWSHALDLRDRETEGHTQRVTETTLQLARLMGMSDAEMVHLRRGSLLHDIGKMGVPDSILLKPAELSEKEWAVMRQHPVYAYEMLAPIKYLRPALDIPYCHHEKWDGSGYPRGLKGEEIPLAARAFAIVDVWDALSSDRPYRPAWPRDRVLEHIGSEAGKHFDPGVVPIFLRLKAAGAH